MFVEKLEDLPESMRGDFVESEFDGKTGYQHKDTVALKNAMKNAKDERDRYKTKFGELESRLNEFEEAKAREIEEAKTKALEEARTAGDVAAIEKRYQEQMQDLEKRSYEKGRLEAASEFKQRQAQQQASAIVDKIAMTIAVDSDSADIISDLIRSRVEIDAETGKEIYKDSKGGALSVNRDEFMKELKSEAKFKRLIKADVATSGGGLANGSGNGSGAGRPSNKNSRADKVARLQQRYNIN